MINWSAFKRIVATAALSGVLAGLLLTAVQQLQIKPIISQAEVFEPAAEKASVAIDAETHVAEHHDSAQHITNEMDAHIHSHGQENEVMQYEHHANAWQPTDGVERTAYTALANVSLAIGFGLFLTAAFNWRQSSSQHTKHSANDKMDGWRVGLLWGLAGYLVFFVAPSLGLPPELPGSQSAPLHDRQLWWLFTVLMSASGLYLLVFNQQVAFKIIGLVLMATPYIIGAPEPLAHEVSSLQALASAFIQATAIANALLWLTLGALMGFFYKKFA